MKFAGGVRQSIKKSLNSYWVALVATILLILLLVVLIANRLYALQAVSGIANINPLISAKNGDLVAVNNEGAPVNTLQTEDTKSKNDDNRTKEKSKQTKMKHSSPKSQGGTSVNNDGTGQGNNQNPPHGPVFSATIDRISSQTLGEKCVIQALFCLSYVYNYRVDATITPHDGTSTINLAWCLDICTNEPSEDHKFTNTAPYNASRNFSVNDKQNHTVKLSVSAPDQPVVEKSVELVWGGS